jgi:hypothetical protein
VLYWCGKDLYGHTEPALCTSLAEPGGAMALGDGSDALPRSGQRLGLRVSGAS